MLVAATTILWAPSGKTMYSSFQNMILATVNAFHATTQIFDNTLNMLHPMALATEKKMIINLTLLRRIKLILLKPFRKKLMTTRPKDIER